MSVTTCLHVMKRLYSVGQKAPTGPLVQQVRHSGGLFSYRQPGYGEPKYRTITGQVLGAFMFWWMFWHLWHEPGHVFGEAEFPYPDPSSWTNEELGIPPDDVD